MKGTGNLIFGEVERINPSMEGHMNDCGIFGRGSEENEGSKILVQPEDEYLFI